MFNEICINEEILPKYKYIYIYIYIYIGGITMNNISQDRIISFE